MGATRPAKAIKIYTAGGVELKGVRDGWHPHFWISTRDAKEDPAEKITYSPSKDDLEEFFEHYFGNNKPFILAEGEYEDDYKKKYTASIKKQKSLKYSPFRNMKKKVEKKETAEASSSARKKYQEILENAQNKLK